MRSLLHAVLVSISLLMLGFRGVAQDNPAVSNSAQTMVKEVAPVELAAMAKEAKVFIYDCNEADMFAEAHVPGAVLTVYDALTAETLPADHSAPLVFYCYSPECPAGCTAARTAARLGFTTVYCMTAGITGWQDAGLATEP